MTRTEQTEKAMQLLPACADGDRVALDQLASWCLPRVRRTVAFMYGSGSEREDLVQNAMSRVFSRLDTFRGEASFFVWVDRITINVVKDCFKKRRFLFFTDDLTVYEGDDHVPVLAPDQETERYRLFDRLAAHFSAIPAKRRMPLVLSLMQGYTVPEIATILDLSFDTVKMRLRRGRGELVARLKNDPYCIEAIEELGR